jgi:hypothetical protein
VHDRFELGLVRGAHECCSRSAVAGARRATYRSDARRRRCASAEIEVIMQHSAILTRIEPRQLSTISGATLSIPDPARLVHLQFRRFAGCPVCHLHLRSFVRHARAISAAGVLEVVVFHSTPQELQPHAGDLPSCVVADPDKRLYREFGVESGARALLDPRAWLPILWAVAHGLVALLRGRARAPSMAPHGGRWGLPADFLIASNGRVVACKYGEHADDQWSVDELLAHASTARGSLAAAPAHGGRPEVSEPG